MDIVLLPSQKPDRFVKVSLAKAGHGNFPSLCPQVPGNLWGEMKAATLCPSPGALPWPRKLVSEEGEAFRLRRLELEGKV